MAGQGYDFPPGYGGQPGMPPQQQPGIPPTQPGIPPQAYPAYQPMPCYYYIASKLNGLVLDIEGASTEPMARLLMWHKKDPLEADNQLWYNDFSTGTIKSKLNNLCIECKDGRLVMNVYQPGNQNQLWEGVTLSIRNRMNTNLVFEIEGGNRDPGAAVVASNLNGLPQQQFEPIFPPPPPGQMPAGLAPTGQMPPGYTPAGLAPSGQMPPGYTPAGLAPSGQISPGYTPAGLAPADQYPTMPPAAEFQPIPTQPAFVKRLFYLVSEMHGKVMDIEGANVREGAAVIVYDKQPNAQNQLWYSDEEGLIRSALNDFVPCATGKSTPLKMVRFTGGASQRFRLDGRKLVNGVGECADIRGASRSSGAQVITYKYNGDSNQHWKMAYV